MNTHDDIPIESQNALSPLSQIATELGRRPKDLAKLAREGIITAEKRKTTWYADKAQIKKELQKITWTERKHGIQEFSRSLMSTLSFITQFLIIYVIIVFLLLAFSDELKDSYVYINFSPLTTGFFLTVSVFFLMALKKATRAIEYAGSIWKYLFTLRDQLSDLKERIELLERASVENLENLTKLEKHNDSLAKKEKMEVPEAG